MASYSFQSVLVSDMLPGGGLRTLRNGTVTVKSAADDSTITVVTSDANGLINVTTTDVPSIYYVTDNGFVSDYITAASILVSAGAAALNNDAGVASFVNDSGSATRAALNSTFEALGEADLRLPLAPAATGSDTAALQAFLTANAGKRVALRQNASYTVSGTLTAGAGTRIVMQGATITQTTDLTPIFTTASDGLAVSGGTLVGKATDYADTTASYPAAAIRATSGAKRVRLIDCEVLGFAGAAVYATGADGVTVRGCRIVGVGDGGGGGTYAFTAGTSKDNAGIIVDGSTTRVWAIDNEISYAAQGILGGATADVHIRGNSIHDIGGQHGVYLNYTDGAEISGNVVKDVAAVGIKVQTQTGGADSTGVTIMGNVVDTAAASGIVFTCDTGTLRHRDVAVTGNSVRNTSNDGIVLEYVENAMCSGNIVKNARAGIRVTDFVGVTVRGNRIKTTSMEGVLVQSLDFSSSQAVVADNEIDDPASANNSSTEFGIRVAEAGSGVTTTDVKVVGNRVVDSLGNMRYGIYYSTADQSTFSTVDNHTTGATDYGFRGPATTARSFRGNSFAGTTGAMFNAPTNFVTNPDTSGATLAALETEVNELKAVLRTAGLIRS